MQRFSFFFALTVAVAMAPAARADTDATDTSTKSETSAAPADADAEATQLADADAAPAPEADSDAQGDPASTEDEGTVSGDADAGGPVSTEGEAPADEEDSKKKDSKKAGTVSEKLKPKKAGADDAEEGSTSGAAALAPGGVVAGGSSFPLGVTASVSSSVGTGTFALGSANNPSVSSSINIRPRYNIPKLVDWQPTALLSGSISAGLEWMSAQSSGGNSNFIAATGPRDRQVRISDGSVSLILPGLIRESFTGISVTPILTGRIPLSVASRFQNRLFGVGGAAMATWNYSTFAGTGTVQYVGSGNYWEHTTNSPTLPCGSQYPTGGGFFPGASLANGTTDLPLTVGRVEEIDSNGQCRVRGRQLIGTVANSLTLAYTTPDLLGSHTFSVNGGAFHTISRPLEYKPELRSQFAQPQSFVNATPWSFASLSYNWSLPGDWIPFGANVQLSGGISSFQTMFDGRGFVRPPFDFVFWAPRATGDAPAGINLQSGNNSTVGFASLTVGI